VSDAFSAESGFRFEVCGAYYREDQDNPDLIEAVVLETPDVEARNGNDYGEVAVKQRVSRTERNEKGIPQQKNGVKPKPGEISEDLEELALDAQDNKLVVEATVTELDRSKSSDMNGDEKIYFVNPGNVDTVQVLQEESSEEDQEAIFDGDEEEAAA